MHGMPAIVSGDWALAETVLPEKTGLHVKPGDGHITFANATSQLFFVMRGSGTTRLADPAAGESPAGWVRVRHRDGGAGFVRATEVWGL
jgi:hypothetical protein